jgi:hypothetical protein
MEEVESVLPITRMEEDLEETVEDTTEGVQCAQQ